MVTEQATKEVQVTVCVPEERTRTYRCATTSAQPEEKTQTYTVCVPIQVEKQVEVQVCKMVAKEVQVPVSRLAAACGRLLDAVAERLRLAVAAAECRHEADRLDR